MSTTAQAHPSKSLAAAGKGRPLVMGILNVTPDSFFTPSRAPSLEEAVRRGLEMERDGADILDVGGESTRPGSEPLETAEELRRVLPVVETLAKKARIPISIDTYKPEVAARALDAGAVILNDVLALRGDAEMPKTAARFERVVLMHMLGESPLTMQDDPRYEDVVDDILHFFRGRLSICAAAGIGPERVWLDPGIGFGKTVEHNLLILRNLEEFASLGHPLLVGASRKSFIGKVLGTEEEPLPVEARLEGSLAAAVRAAQAGAECVRVHDVAETFRVLELWRRIRRG